MSNKEITVSELVHVMNAFKVGLFKGKGDGANPYLRIIAGEKRYFLNNTRVEKEDGTVSYVWKLGEEMKPRAEQATLPALAVMA